MGDNMIQWDELGLVLFKDFYLFIFRKRKERRKGEKHQCVVASCVSPTGTWPATQASVLYWESNW